MKKVLTENMSNIESKQGIIKKSNSQHLIANSKERHRVFYSLAILVLMIIAIAFVALQKQFQLTLINQRAIRGLRGATGQAAAWGFAFSIAMYAVRRVIKRTNSMEIKQKLLILARFTREWHVPISVIGFAIILLHIYVVLARSFVLDVRYVSGLIAFIILGVQMLSGIFRYKRKGVKFHMITGISFIIAMLIHVMA